jgi:two-component system, cell cycle response regulator
MLIFGKRAKLAQLCTAVVEKAEDGVVIIDDAHNIIHYNAGAEHIFGYTIREVLGKHLDMLIPERFHLQHDLHIREFSTNAHAARGMGDRARQIYGRRKDGSEFVCSISIIKVGTGNEQCFAAIVRDISENKKTEEELLRLAATDPLTGAYNRREFTSLADREALRAQRYHHPLTILMLDIDHFKKLNDTYGHAAGDKALQRFTTLCCNALRNVDIFGRWGGEEFVALLPETPADGAAIIAERLRKMVSDTVVNFNDHKVTFSVSIGVAQYRDGETTIDLPLSRADAAVYDAKKAGRNRISVYRN